MDNRGLKKRDLPSYFRIPHLKFCVKSLLKDYEILRLNFIDVKEANPLIERAHPHLVSQLSGKHIYEEAALTEADDGLFPENFLMSESQSVKRKLQLRDTDSPLSEHSYRIPTLQFRETYFYSQLSQFKSTPTRIRMARLVPGGVVDWHIDYDPTYAVRVIIPILTHAEVRYSMRIKGEVTNFHLPSDGHGWFINTGFPHRVENAGVTDRIALLVSIRGQGDLEPYFKSSIV